jgi:hypothetical protein
MKFYTSDFTLDEYAVTKISYFPASKVQIKQISQIFKFVYSTEANRVCLLRNLELL